MMGIDMASATLARATHFFGAGYCLEGPHRAKAIGNGLRELDRFLNLLIDEVAAALALPDLDSAAFARQRNTANKLGIVEMALSSPSRDADRLRAIGRSRDALFHCAGVVRRGDCRGSDLMTAGWPAPRLGLGDTIPVSAIDLASVCRFYDRVAGKLVAACGG